MPAGGANASAASRQRVPAWRTTGATSSRTPSSAALTPSAVDLGDAGEVEEDRRRPALELVDGAAGAGRRVDELADVPTATARATHDSGGLQRVGRRVQRLDDDAVVRRRTEAVERGVRVDFSALATAASQSSRVADALMSPGYGTPQPVAASANAAIDGKRQSGVTGPAVGVAPVPVRSWRRSIHTVGRPCRLGRLVVVVQRLGDVQQLGAGGGVEQGGEVCRARLVRADVLGGDHEVELDSEPAGAGGERRPIDVGEDDQAEPLVQLRRARRSSPGTPASSAPRRRTPPAPRR